MSKPHLTYVINTLQTGGAEVGMTRLICELQSYDINITVVALDGRDHEVVPRLPEETEVIDLGIKGFTDIPHLIRLVRLLQRTDILVTSLFHSTVLGRILGRVVGVETMLDWQHNVRFFSTVKKKVYEYTAILSDGILADSERVHDMLRKNSSIPNSMIYTVPIAGIDLEKFESSSEEHTSDRIVVGTLGRLYEQKNPIAILDVAEILGEDFEFKIAGQGPLEPVLEEEIKSRNLSNVNLVGYVDSVPEFLSTLDIYFQPSKFEGLCLTVLEAMACRLPVVASSVGGIQDTVVHGETGFTTSPDNIEEFADYLRILARNPNKRSRFADRARERVRKKYSRDALISSFLKVLKSAHGRDFSSDI